MRDRRSKALADFGEYMSPGKVRLYRRYSMTVVMDDR